MLLSHAPGIIHDYLFQFFSRKSIVFNSKSNNKLITSSTSFYLHYPWQHFLEMVDVAVTLVSINRTPECFNSVNKLLFWSWLYFPNVLVPHNYSLLGLLNWTSIITLCLWLLLNHTHYYYYWCNLMVFETRAWFSENPTPSSTAESDARFYMVHRAGLSLL